MHVLHRSGKNGLGAAYIAGFDWGLEQGYDVIVEMDADGSHAPEQLPRLLAAWPRRCRFRLALGTGGHRAGLAQVARAAVARRQPLRAVGARESSLRDITGGYRAYRREVLEQIDYAAVASQGYCFQMDLAWRALRAGFHVVEVPITFAERQRGESKMSGSIVREAILRVTQWGIEYRRQSEHREASL